MVRYPSRIDVRSRYYFHIPLAFSPHCEYDDFEIILRFNRLVEVRHRISSSFLNMNLPVNIDLIGSRKWTLVSEL